MKQTIFSVGSGRRTYWVVTIFVALVFFITGMANLFSLPHMEQEMLALGYPRYFMVILGSWKVLGAVAIVLPGMRLVKEWAYAGLIFDLTGATVSRLASGSGMIMVVVPVAFACLVMLSWSLRPPEKKLF